MRHHSFLSRNMQEKQKVGSVIRGNSSHRCYLWAEFKDNVLLNTKREGGEKGVKVGLSHAHLRGVPTVPITLPLQKRPACHRGNLLNKIQSNMKNRLSKVRE